MPRVSGVFLGTVVLGGCVAVGGWSLLAAESGLSAGGGASGLAGAAAPAGASSDAPSRGEPPRLREGTGLVDATGHFERAAEGLIFVREGGVRLVGLENLNLQRIARTLLAVEAPAGVKWKVSGTITEYEGRNFILIERAVYSPTRR